MSKDLENTFSWSVTRAQLFRNCRRAYYYTYYGSWGGWSASAPERIRLLYRLKNLKTMILWAGGLVHDTIKDALAYYSKTRRWPTVEETQNHARTQMRADWRDAIDKAWLQYPKKTNIAELYYGNGRTLPREQTDAIKARVFEALDNFHHSAAVKQLLATPVERWLTIDTLDSFLIDDCKIWCAIDFAFRDEDGFIHIIDWKTGAENRLSLRQQLGCYGLYAMEKWSVTPEALHASGVFLNDGGRTSGYPIDAELLVSVKDQILCSIRSMKAKLRDADHNLADEDDFEFTQDTTTCLNCPFRQVCPQTAETAP